MVTMGADPARWFVGWFAIDVLYKLAVGLAVGVLVGWLLGRLFFRARSHTLRLAAHADGFVALAATFLAYGLAEVAAGYGFLAVFACALAIRNAERGHEYHQVLHDFVEQVERLLTVLLLILFGGALVGGLLGPLTWQGAAVGVAVVLLIRPLAAWVSLRGTPATPGERAAIAAFGIRGIGTFYYLAYAMATVHFAGGEEVWAVAAFVVVVSVVGHGIATQPIMAWLDRRREAEGRTVAEPDPAVAG
jgi:NhaP-type Na+/H+ or K+/H+ antiporter